MDMRLSSEQQHECRKILSELDSLGHQGSFCATLQSRYNQIIDDQRKSSLPDPLDVLPLEICAQIFAEAVSADGDQVDNALLLSSVSSRWLRTIISISSLWTSITIQNKTQDASARTAACLALSGERKISVYILTPTWREYMEMLTPHTNRIELIGLGSFHDVPRFIESLGYLPALVSISFPYSFDLPDAEDSVLQLMDNAPSLKSLGALNLTRPILHHPRATKLTSLQTQVPLYDLVRILSITMKPLQLSISYLRLDASLGDERMYLEYDPRTSISIDTLHLPWSSPIVYDRLFNHYIRSIRSLHITISDEYELGELLFALRSSKVEELWVGLFREFGPISSRSEYAILSSLRKLVIISYQTRSLDSLMVKIPTIMPSLAYLGIENLILGKRIYDLEQLQHIQDLSVFFSSSMVILKESIHFKSLKRLRLSLESPFDLSFMESPILMDIYTFVRAHTTSSTFLPISYLIPTSSFSTLISINVPRLPAHLRLESLPLLRRLHFGWEVTKAWGCDLLEQLIYVPTICPNLELIDISSTLVEWDIVLLMLIRRNFLHDKAVSRVQAMGFRYPLPIQLAWPISNLLRSRLVPGLELGEISLERVVEILFSTPSEPPRCEHCSYMVEENCTHPSTVPASDSAPFENATPTQFIVLSPDPPLPAYMVQWLSRKWVRRKAFVAASQEVRARGQKLKSCRPWLNSCLVTGDTMERLDSELRLD
ncbi:hypothetical protein FRC17_002762 [Serendipita sp. 399]|nr:hypothetical protein FRC17_002762 [Serendipita sp. 399]